MYFYFIVLLVLSVLRDAEAASPVSEIEPILSAVHGEIARYSKQVLDPDVVRPKNLKIALEHPSKVLDFIASWHTISSRQYQKILLAFPDQVQVVVQTTKRLMNPSVSDLQVISQLERKARHPELYQWALQYLLGPVLESGRSDLFRTWLKVCKTLSMDEFLGVRDMWKGDPSLVAEAAGQVMIAFPQDVVQLLHEMAEGFDGSSSPLLWDFVKEGDDFQELLVVRNVLNRVRPFDSDSYWLLMLQLGRIAKHSSHASLLSSIAWKISRLVQAPKEMELRVLDLHIARPSLPDWFRNTLANIRIEMDKRIHSKVSFWQKKK
jgi:hypothetical protein